MIYIIYKSTYHHHYSTQHPPLTDQFFLNIFKTICYINNLSNYNNDSIKCFCLIFVRENLILNDNIVINKEQNKLNLNLKKILIIGRYLVPNY